MMTGETQDKATKMKGPYRPVGSGWGKGASRDRVGRRKVRDRNTVVGEVCKEF